VGIGLTFCGTVHFIEYLRALITVEVSVPMVEAPAIIVPAHEEHRATMKDIDTLIETNYGKRSADAVPEFADYGLVSS